MSDTLSANSIFSNLSWPTICEMIEQLAETEDADATTFRTSLEEYMAKVWPYKLKEYQKYRETNPRPARTIANEIRRW